MGDSARRMESAWKTDFARSRCRRGEGRARAPRDSGRCCRRNTRWRSGRRTRGAAARDDRRRGRQRHRTHGHGGGTGWTGRRAGQSTWRGGPPRNGRQGAFRPRACHPGRGRHPQPALAARAGHVTAGLFRGDRQGVMAPGTIDANRHSPARFLQKAPFEPRIFQETPTPLNEDYTTILQRSCPPCTATSGTAPGRTETPAGQPFSQCPEALLPTGAFGLYFPSSDRPCNARKCFCRGRRCRPTPLRRLQRFPHRFPGGATLAAVELCPLGRVWALSVDPGRCDACGGRALPVGSGLGPIG